MNLAWALILIQLCEACAELIFRRLKENHSLELSCHLQRGLGSLTGLHLYHRDARSQTTLLSMAQGRQLRVDPEHRGRLRLSGALDSPQVNVTMTSLQQSDTGLYMWELSHRQENSPDFVTGAQKVFLLVEGAERPCHCSASYPPLLVTIFAAAGLIGITLTCLATEKCCYVYKNSPNVKNSNNILELRPPEHIGAKKLRVRHHHRPRPPVPIYEEMTRKQQCAATPQNNHAAPSHLEEDNFPLYANPNIRQPQDNYYACPRQLACRE